MAACVWLGLAATLGYLPAGEVRLGLGALLVLTGGPALWRGLKAGPGLLGRVRAAEQALLAGLFGLQLVNFGVSWAQGLELPQVQVRLQAGQLLLAFGVVWVTWRTLADRRGG